MKAIIFTFLLIVCASAQMVMSPANYTSGGAAPSNPNWEDSTQTIAIWYYEDGIGADSVQDELPCRG